MLTVRSAIEMGVRHALRGARPASEFEELQILRFAWDTLLGMNAWGWARNRTASLAIVPGQDWIALPDDFGELVSVYRDGTVVEHPRQVSMDVILRARSTGLAYIADAFLYAHGWRAESPDEPPVQRLEIYPAQTVAGSAELLYHSGGLRLRNGCEDSGVIPVPADGSCDMLFVDIVRAIAQGYELDDTRSKEQALAIVRAGETFQGAVRRDNNRVQRRRPNPAGGWLGGIQRRGPREVMQEPADLGAFDG